MKYLILLGYLILAIIVAVALSIGRADAQSMAACSPHDQVVKILTENYGEEQTIIALTANNLVMELFVNPDTASWTALITHPDGNTCIVSAGENFEFAVTEVPGVDG